MAKKTLNSLDLNKTIGTVLLTDGETSIDVPRFGLKKILGIARFIGIDGIRIYSRINKLLKDPEMEITEKVIYREINNTSSVHTIYQRSPGETNAV